MKVRTFNHEEDDMLKAVGIDAAEYDAAVQQYNEKMEQLKAEGILAKKHYESKYVQYMVDTFDPVMALMLQRHIDRQKYDCLKKRIALMQLMDIISS